MTGKDIIKYIAENNGYDTDYDFINDKKIGFNACINAFGRDFYEENKNRCVFAAGNEEGKGLWCFMGISTDDSSDPSLHLTAKLDDWDYYTSCYVQHRKVLMDKCKLP